MSERTQLVTTLVENLYETSAMPQAKWMWNHVQIAAQTAELLAQKYQANQEYVTVAALLHDIGDAHIPRSREDYRLECEVITRGMLRRANFDKAEINVIISDIIEPHSCHPDHLPPTIDGKVFATADALTHLTTNYYPELTRERLIDFGIELEPEKFKKWKKSKIEKEFKQKIFFEEEKKAVKERYKELIKSI